MSALVGGGTDEASVNIAKQNSMRGIMQTAYPWLVCAWSYAHRLELACKNAFTSTLHQRNAPTFILPLREVTEEDLRAWRDCGTCSVTRV